MKDHGNPKDDQHMATQHKGETPASELARADTHPLGNTAELENQHVEARQQDAGAATAVSNTKDAARNPTPDVAKSPKTGPKAPESTLAAAEAQLPTTKEAIKAAEKTVTTHPQPAAGDHLTIGGKKIEILGVALSNHGINGSEYNVTVEGGDNGPFVVQNVPEGLIKRAKSKE